MGYAGYVPAKLPPTKPSAVQAALWEIQNTASLEVISKLLRNTAVNPSEEKYRRIRLTNPKVKALIAEEKGAVQSLLALGWERDAEDSESLVIPKGRYFSMAEVRIVQDAEERLKKSLRDAKRAEGASKIPSSQEQARIRAQMEADRQQRSSKAQQ